MLGTQTGPPQLQARSGTCGAVWPQTPSFAVQRAAALGGSPTVLEPLARPCFLAGSSVPSPSLGLTHRAGPPCGQALSL